MSNRKHGVGRTAWMGCVVIAAATASVGGVRSARGTNTTIEVPREGALPDNARSFWVSDSIGITIMNGPGLEFGIGGRTAPAAQLPVYESRRGRGCRHVWVRIGLDAWVCGDYGQLSQSEPNPRRYADVGGAGALPWEYVFVQRYHTHAYRTLQAALSQSTNVEDFEEWEANWGFAVREMAGGGGQRVVRSFSGYFLRRSEVYGASISNFSGAPFQDLAGGEPNIPFGWIAGYFTRVFPAPGARAATEQAERLSRVHVYATTELNGQQWARIGENRWVRADKVRFIAPEPPPELVNVGERERWIDVDLSSQTLLAYEGATPVYATMVSTGGERFPTPAGVFRINSRYAHKNMDNVEARNLPNHFSFADVPFVQFFDNDRGFHGVYWHDQFGVARSHGCVNMAPRDAAWLFNWTSHPLPAGWQSREIAAGQGTLVRVRGEYHGPWGR